MPITLPPISRRKFLRGTLAAAGGMLVAGCQHQRVVLEDRPDHLALLADTHIAADRKLDPRKQGVIWERFAQVSQQVVSMSQRPAAVLVNGDCAFRSGEKADYAALVDALKPLRHAGLPIHLGLGNHDDRDNIHAALPADERVAAAPALQRRVMRIRMTHANWYVLDSLDQVNVPPGRLGGDQLAWLARSLDSDADRPAILMMHHQPDERPIEKVSGLLDTAPLLNLIRPRRQVKAVLFGHTHVWKHYERDGIHFINQPATAYAFKKDQPTGWVDARVERGKMRLQLHAISLNHSKDGEVLDLPWRT